MYHKKLSLMNLSYIILKFGGKSVSELQCWQTIHRITERHLAQGLRPLIVCSAVSGVTDLLEQLLITAMDGQPELVLSKIFARHQQLAQDLGVSIDLIKTDCD